MDIIYLSVIPVAILIGGVYAYNFAQKFQSSLNHAFFPVYALDELEEMHAQLMKTDKSLRTADRMLKNYQIDSGKQEKLDKAGYRKAVEAYCSELIWFQMAQVKLNHMREANFEVHNGESISEVRERCDEIIGRMQGIYHQNETKKMVSDWLTEKK